LIAGPVALATPPGAGITRRDVETAEQMRGALRSAAAEADAVVMVAAVADFRPARRVPGKLSRRAKPSAAATGATGAVGTGEPSAPSIMDGLPLGANPDLLAELGSVRRRAGREPFPLLVGFAAETGTTADTLIVRARAKLVEKGCDVVVANDVGEAGLGFGSDENAVTLVFADGTAAALARASKGAIADRIWDQLVARRGAPARATRSARPARAADARRPKAVRPPPIRRARPAPARGRRG
jgi:phosphopantothenoylcysteine decarboxylase/phosphopantothenate--cysteine ligase